MHNGDSDIRRLLVAATKLCSSHSESTRVTMRRFLPTIFFGVVFVAIAACGSDSTNSKNDVLASEVSTSVPRPLMPNVICLTLQMAQNLIQDQGVFLSYSQDATGQNRNQLVDSNWIVIEQNLRPGEQFSEGDAVLQVLKTDEAKDRGLCQ